MDFLEGMKSGTNEIAAHDRVCGEIFHFSILNYENGYYLPALLLLFIGIEQVLGDVFPRNDEGRKLNFFQMINQCHKDGLINDEEKKLLHESRLWRNRLLHDQHYEWAFENGGLLQLLSEEEARKLLFEDYAPKCLLVLARLIAE